MTRPKTFVCGCREDGGGEPLYWRRASNPDPNLEWSRTSCAAYRGYLKGRVAQIVYVWGSTYDCVSHDPSARPVPWTLFVCVSVMSLLNRLCVTENNK